MLQKIKVKSDAEHGVYSGSETNSLTITSAPVTMYGYRYRMTATNQCGTANSNGAILTFSTTWTGTSSGNWNVSGNWSCGLPDQNTDAVIPVTGNAPTVNIAGTVRNLTINSGATLTIGNNNSRSPFMGTRRTPVPLMPAEQVQLSAIVAQLHKHYPALLIPM